MTEVDFDKPIFVKDTNRPVTIIRRMKQTALEIKRGVESERFSLSADWDGDGKARTILYDHRQLFSKYRVSNAKSYVAPQPTVNPRSEEAHQLLAKFWEAEGSTVEAEKSRQGKSAPRYHSLALFIMDHLS